MTEDEQLLEKVKNWYKEAYPEQFEKFGEMLDVKDGKFKIIETKELSDTEQMLLANVFTMYLLYNPD